VKDDDSGLDELTFGVSVTPAGYWTMLPLVHK
jgi:hypothetical protein